MHGHTSIRKFNKRPDKNIYKIFWNIRYTQCCLGREKVGPLRTSLASHSHLPWCRNQRYNLWSWTYLLRKNLKNKSLLELTVCLFNISFQRGYIDILFLLLSRINFERHRLELNSRPIPVVWPVSPVYQGDHIWNAECTKSMYSPTPSSDQNINLVKLLRPLLVVIVSMWLRTVQAITTRQWNMYEFYMTYTSWKFASSVPRP